jgi:LuxR family transcriptional regulator, maltose regulon positive regulatory protein
MDEHETIGLGRELHVGLSAEMAARLTRQTEGWPALLALAALGAVSARDTAEPIGSDVDRLVAEYLRYELLERRPRDEIAFLTRTSILERLTGPVCDAVVNGRGSTELLGRLARSTLLVEGYGGSYRYHTLLRDFLRAELAVREPGRVATFHRRAATWYEANGSLELAVDHAFAAGDVDLAASLVGKGIVVHHWSGRRATTRAWVRHFSDGDLEARPWLAVLGAWVEISEGDVVTTIRLADIVERGTSVGRPPDGTTSFESGQAMLRAAMSRRGADDALANAARAVELEPEGSPWRDFALWILAFTRLATGDRDGADAALAESVAAARSVGNANVQYTALGHRALLAVERGDWQAAVAYMEEGDQLGVAASAEGYPSAAPARAARIRLAIQRGDIAEARRDLVRAAGFRPRLTVAAPALSVQSILAFARAHLAAGDPAGARALVEQARGLIRQRPDLGVLPGEVNALEASLASSALTRGGASSLTVAELRVLGLLPYYLSFKEIGQRLGVKETTVKSHALAIYTKLGAASRGDAVDRAVEAGLLERFGPVASDPPVRATAARPAN